jgi:hypothetical protein
MNIASHRVQNFLICAVGLALCLAALASVAYI